MTFPTIPTGPSFSSDLYSEVGGHQTFENIVRTFYEGVQNDPVLWPMYPEHDLEGAIERLTLFLVQYWGGPTTYSEQRGHPRLRLRHAAYKVNPDARDRWLKHMSHALENSGLAPMYQETLMAHMDRAAHSLVNTFEE